MADFSDMTRETLELELQAARTETRAIETRLEKVCALIGSARINIECCQAIMHLARYQPHALGTNAHPNQHLALNAALEDLMKAVGTADLIPF